MNRTASILLATLAMGLATTVADGISDDQLPRYEYSSAEVGAAAESDLEAALAPFRLAGKLDRKTPEFERVHRLFLRVLDVAKRRSDFAKTLDWEIHIHEGRFAEAYSRAGGKLVISAGFLQYYRPNDAELAFVIGHEIAHAICEHERMNLSAVWRRNAPRRLQPRYAMEFLDTEPLLRAMVAPAARLQERVADRVGIELATAAGIDVYDSLGFLDKSANEERGGGVFLDMHDTAIERKIMLLQTAAPFQPLARLFRGREPDCSP